MSFTMHFFKKSIKCPNSYNEYVRLNCAIVVHLQGVSDFCVSPDKFIVNQTKDFLSAGNLSFQTELHTPGLFIEWEESMLTVLFVPPYRCRALLFVLQYKPAKPFPTGID